LGDRQSSHPVKTLLQYYGKFLEALPGVAYPGFRDNRSTLNTKTGFLKKISDKSRSSLRVFRNAQPDQIQLQYTTTTHYI